VNCEIALREAVHAQVIGEKTPVTRERFDSMDRQARRKLSGQNQVVANGRAHVDEAAIRRKASNQVNKDFLFVRLVNISFPIACPLSFEELILENANSILEGVNGAIHRD
jgi:hypothetical protein